MDGALKTMVLESVDSTYIFDLHNVFTGCMGSPKKDIMNHIITRYGQITAEDIIDKKKSLQ